VSRKFSAASLSRRKFGAASFQPPKVSTGEFAIAATAATEIYSMHCIKSVRREIVCVFREFSFRAASLVSRKFEPPRKSLIIQNPAQDLKTTRILRIIKCTFCPSYIHGSFDGLLSSDDLKRSDWLEGHFWRSNTSPSILPNLSNKNYAQW
jgi:hypothetical protein